MKRSCLATVGSLALTTGLITGAAAFAAPAQADPGTDSFLNALTTAGLTGVDPATAIAVGQQVCPMLSEPGQRAADVAGQVADAIGRPLGPATMFTGLAISIFCPAVVARVGNDLANGTSPIPLSILGL